MCFQYIWQISLCFDVCWVSIFVSSVNGKVPLFSSWHHFCLPAQVDWDSVQDDVDFLMLLSCFSNSLENLHWCLRSTSRSQTAALFPIRLLSSLPVLACLLGSDVEIRLAEDLWNYLKSLYNVLLNFAYRSNTTATDSFIYFPAIRLQLQSGHPADTL